MENASKALIIAGEILIAILILSLLIYAWGRYSKYKNSQVELADIENTAKFNEQFTNYDRDDVAGYELLTLINKIVDYNERKTTDSNINANTYNAIKIQIDFKDEGTEVNRKKLVIDNTIGLFTKSIYKDDQLSAKNRNSPGSFKHDIDSKMETAKRQIGIAGEDDTKAEKVAKNIKSIFKTADEIENLANSKYGGNNNYVYKDMANTYNISVGIKDSTNSKYMTINKAKQQLIIGANAYNNSYYRYACQFYEYMQFKRSIFKCSKTAYDDVSGRISEIYFEFVDIH